MERTKDFRALAAKQHGLVGREQLMGECGFSRQRIGRDCQAGRLEAVHSGVYRLAGSPQTWRQRVMAAVLWAPGAIASHRTAAALWGLDGFPEDGVEIMAPKRLRVEHPSFTVRRGTVPAALVTKRDGIPVTTVPRLLADLGLVLPADRFGRVVEDALRRGLTAPGPLRAFLVREDRRRHRGNGVLRAWLDDGEPQKGPSASAFQREVRDLLRPLGAFREEAEIHDESGRLLARVDFLFDAAPVGVEADGRKDHSSREDWWHDLKRRNQVTSQGIYILHVTPDDLKTPEGREAFLARVEGTLGRVTPAASCR